MFIAGNYKISYFLDNDSVRARVYEVLYGPLESTPLGIAQPAWLQQGGFSGLMRPPISSHGFTIPIPGGANQMYNMFKLPTHGNYSYPMLNVGVGEPLANIYTGHPINPMIGPVNPPVLNSTDTIGVVDEAAKRMNILGEKMDELHAMSKECMEKLQAATASSLSKKRSQHSTSIKYRRRRK